MKLQRPKLTPFIDADLAIGVINRNIEALTCLSAPVNTGFVYCGTHERTAKGDEMTISVASSAKRNAITYRLKRDSLYHILPEDLFHPLDRYANCDGDKETFLENRTAQKEIERDALEYFHPFDTVLTHLRVRFQECLNSYILGNERFIIDFITENESIDKNNTYIKSALPYILRLRADRGSKALIILLVNAVFGSGLVDFSCRYMEIPIEIDPISCHITLDGEIDSLFCGETIMNWIEVFEIKFQLELKTHEEIEQTTHDIKDFIKFIGRWFLSDRQTVNITFGDFSKDPVISDNSIEGGLFLNYNTQLLVS